MMTLDEYRLLTEPDVRRAVEANRGRNPLEVALDKRLAHAALVATQVKYLARAAAKLPSYAAAGCILPPLAFEQASSEACATHKRIGGGRLLELTCGLGVDTLFLSRRFEQVVTLERSEVLAAVARENFRRLGVTNVEVVNAPAEEYLARCAEHFDWLYADPDRRSADGRKQLRLEASSPDVLALLPRLKEVADRLCFKLSPLFDVDEAFRLFGPCRVEAVSLGDECKELVVSIDGEPPLLEATALGRGSFALPPAGRDGATPPGAFLPERYGWLVQPDVALQKCRLARRALEGVADIWSDNGYGFAAGEPRDVLGRVFAIERIEPFDPGRLRRELRGCGAELLKHDFPLSGEELARRLGVRRGGGVRLAFTRIEGRFWTIRLK